MSEEMRELWFPPNYDINNRTDEQKAQELAFAIYVGCYEGTMAEKAMEEVARLDLKIEAERKAKVKA